MYCPRCNGPVDANATACPLCSADFTNPEGWHPTATPGAVTNKVSGSQLIVSILLGLLGLLGLFMTVCGLLTLGAGVAGLSILSMVVGISFIAIATRSFKSTGSNGDAGRPNDPPS